MLTLILALAAQAVTPQPGELKLFGDWTVACDNSRACEAIALQPEVANSEEFVTMSFRRGAGVAAAPHILIQNVEQRPAHLLVGDLPFAARFTDTIDGFVVEAADPDAFLAALRGAHSLQLRDADQVPIGYVSLAGASATMLYMDEQQRRLGTVTALVRRGDLPAGAVPPPPALPTVRLAPAPTEASIEVDAARIETMRRQTGCTIDEVGGPDEHYAHPIAPGQTLILLTCGTGAYNLSLVPFVAQRRNGRLQIEVAGFDDQWAIGELGRPTLINGDWDPERRLLRENSMARGLGDCGTRSEYGWDGDRFRLVRREEMGECRGSLYYVTTWRAEVVGR